MALVRANTSGGGSGKIPFTVDNTAYTGRTTISAQDCYMYDDNGTPKVHLDITFTTITSLSDGMYIFNNFPSFTVRNVSIASSWRLELYNSSHGGMLMCANGSVSSGQTFHIVKDYTMEYVWN